MRRRLKSAPMPELSALEEYTWAVAGRDGRLLTPVHAYGSSVDGRPAEAILVENLEKVARYRNLLNLRNPDRNNPLAGKIDFHLLRRNPQGEWVIAQPDPNSGQQIYETGEDHSDMDLIAFEVHNRSGSPVYISLLDFSQFQDVALLYPPGRPSEKLVKDVKVGVRDEERMNLRLYLPPEFPYDEDVETYKLLVTSQEVDFSWMEQEAAAAAWTISRKDPRGVRPRFSNSYITRLTSGTRATQRVQHPTSGEAWITIERPFVLRRKSKRASTEADTAAQPSASLDDKTAGDRAGLAAGEIDTRNMINLSVDGTFRKTGLISTRPGDVDAIFDDLRRQQSSHLLLYFHGGLVKEAAGMKTANALREVFMDQANVYPVFFVWETGLLEILKRNLDKISQQPLFKQLGEHIMKFAWAKLQAGLGGSKDLEEGLRPASEGEVEAARSRELAGEEAIGEAEREALEPLSDEEKDSFVFFLEDHPEFQATQERILNSLEASPKGGRGDLGESGLLPEEVELLSQDVVAELEKEAQPGEEGGKALVSTAFLVKTAVSVLSRVIQRFVKRTDHGLVCTTTEEILRQFYLDALGAMVWSGMKDQAQAAFDDNSGLSGEDLHGGTYFLEKLRRYMADGSNPPLKVSLVGHSAGSIYICRLFEKALETLPQDFKFQNVVFLAPGVDFDLFNATIVDAPGSGEILPHVHHDGRLRDQGRHRPAGLPALAAVLRLRRAGRAG